MTKGIKYMYFIGIGGIGMSALARYFRKDGKQVAGYDKTPSALTQQLIAEGMGVHYNDDISLIPKEFLQAPKESVLVVYTPAVPANHSEFVYFKDHGYAIKKRSEVLGLITEQTYTIAVAGTHGKTTTSSMTAHILKMAGIDCWAFLGGITQNYNTNILVGTQSIAVVEADEYDRSFLTLHPDIAIITSVDADHLDIYGAAEDMYATYRQFASQVKPKGVLVIKDKADMILGTKTEKQQYSLSTPATNHAENIRIEKGKFIYDIVAGEHRIKNISLGVPGRHNVENSVAAASAALIMGVKGEIIQRALSSFRGVKRRFEYHIRNDKTVFIDDYAHHPEELRACITAVRELYPDKRLTGIFQPHLYSRTRDFADAFAESLDLLDEIILLDIYPAREEPIPGITSKMLLGKMKKQNKHLVEKKDLAGFVSDLHPEVLITMGAGDIELLVEPLKNALEAA